MENDKIINGILKSPDMVALTSLMDFFTLPEKELTIDLQGEPYTYTPLRIAKTESDFSELLSHLVNRRNYSDTEIAKTLIADEIEALLRESKDQYVRPKSTLKDKSLIELAYKFLGWLSVTDQREPVAGGLRNYEIALRHWFLEKAGIEPFIQGKEIVNKYGAKKVEVFVNEIRKQGIDHHKKGLHKQLTNVYQALSDYPSIQEDIQHHLDKLE